MNNSPPCLGEIKNIFHYKRKISVMWDVWRLGENTVPNGRTAFVPVIVFCVFVFFQVKWEMGEV